MSRGSIATYKKFHKYVSLKMPEVRNVVAILDGIRGQAGTITKARIKEALEWGKGPMIKVEVMSVAGEFTPGTNEIRIRKQRVDEFEAGRGLVTAPNGKLVYYVGVILLHELTHWADDQDGVDNPLEEGDEFEKAMYGGVVHAP